MSKEEKEAIEILKDNIGILEGKLTIKYTNYNTVKAYNTILNLINNQQKEIEEEHEKWKELLHEYGVKCQEIEELKENQIWSEATIEGLKTDFIHKDTIREKIKNLEENIDNLYNSSSLETAYCQAELDHLREKKDMLQELLEE